jgi:predicted transcriptional regulator
MPVTRRTVLEELAAASDAKARRTTTVGAIASELGADEGTIEAHLGGLLECELARESTDGVRVTVTGEELLELDADETIVIDPK